MFLLQSNVIVPHCRYNRCQFLFNQAKLLLQFHTTRPRLSRLEPIYTTESNPCMIRMAPRHLAFLMRKNTSNKQRLPNVDVNTTRGSQKGLGQLDSTHVEPVVLISPPDLSYMFHVGIICVCRYIYIYRERERERDASILMTNIVGSAWIGALRVAQPFLPSQKATASCKNILYKLNYCPRPQAGNPRLAALNLMVFV